MAKSIIQARTGPADRECFLCREEGGEEWILWGTVSHRSP